MSNPRKNIKAAHQQLDADLAAGDPTAEALVGMLRGETDTVRDSLGLSPLLLTSELWIGFKFGTPTNGVLILGESTYGADPPLTKYIPSWCRGNQPDQTFTRIFNAFSGSHSSSATPSEREAFWATIAFANFVNQPVGPTRDYRPTTAHYRDAALALPAILQRLKPKPRGVLILGREQSEYSVPVLRDLGLPFVVCRHPGARGVPTTELKTAWNELKTAWNELKTAWNELQSNPHGMKITRQTQSHGDKAWQGWHILTVAEQGFSMLDCYRSHHKGISDEHIKDFVEGVNGTNKSGTLHPRAPISAVPRHFFRDLAATGDPAVLDEFKRHVRDFLEANVTSIHAKRVLVDFHVSPTPVPPHYLDAAEEVFREQPADSVIDEVVIFT
jgi:hypothetical protein